MVRLSRVLQLREKLLSNEQPDTLTSISDLAVLYQFQGLYDKPCIKLVCTSSRIWMENTVPAYRPQPHFCDRYDFFARSSMLITASEARRVISLHLN